MEMNRIEELITISHYVAPNNRVIRPVLIPDSNEYIEILTGGKVFFEVDGVEREFGEGTIFWHIGGEYTIHMTPRDNPYRCLVLRFRMAEQRRVVPRVTHWGDLQDFKEFCKEALRYGHDERVDRQVLVAMLYSQVLWRAYMSTRQIEMASYPVPLTRALQVLNRDFAAELNIKSLAQRSGVSEPYLYSLFKRHLNESPHQFLLNRRLRQARIWLANNEKSIKEISLECGFENLESFYRAFKRNCGLTPAEFRRRNIPTEYTRFG